MVFFKYTDPSAAMAEAEWRIANCQKEGKTELDLGGMGLLELPITLSELDQLQKLDLHNNRLRELPSFLSKLERLHWLDLHDNQLRALPPFIGNLKQLQWLSLHGNRLRTLPSNLGKLDSLEQLFAFGNRLRRLPNSIGNLKHLKHFLLHNNRLQELPVTFGGLKELQRLYLNGNQLLSLPTSLGELTQLQGLSLRDNHLGELPSSLSELVQLRYLWIDGNPNLGIPTEIAATEDAQKILGYYFRTEGAEAAIPLNEFKLILVGRGGVGKTSLVHRLLWDKYREFKRTPGIQITQWAIPIENDDAQANVWDFGGQEIMHGTHRFFMTERALYLVLVEHRHNTEEYDAEYWLSMVRSFAGDEAPIIVLLHKWDDGTYELNRELLRDKYGRDLIFLETDSKTGNGIKELEAHICELAGAMPGLKAKWPAAWRLVKEELPAAKKNWLSFADFCTFCHARNVTQREDQEALAESLHALGLMLAYRKEEALRGFGVLNPQWVTKGIYDLLNATELRAQNGKFTYDDFAKLLPARNYPAALHPYLLALMRKFRLCFPLDDDDREYLIPELLTKEEPKLDAEFPPEQCLGFIYRYESVLPEGLLPRFIVETYVHREPKHAWRTGVVLERANCRALVRGDVLGRMVTIRVTGAGNGQRELLGIIREHFERIHRSFEKLPVRELVPVPGHPEVLIPYADLLDYEAANDDEYKVVIDIGEQYLTLRQPVKLSVKKLLDGIDIPGMVRGEDLGRLRFIQGVIGAGLSLFISYSHKDEFLRDELRGALTAYERKCELRAWDDTRIEPGQKWEPEILGNLERADIIVLLLSNDFIRSDYCMQKEWEIAKLRDAKGECAIVPIVVRDCRFDKLEVGQIQAIQPGGKPIKQHRDRDAAWLEVTKQLDRVIARLKKRGS